MTVRYKEALDWIERNVAPTEPRSDITPSKKQKEPGVGAGRGGARSPIVSNAIDGIIAEGFLDKAKMTSEVYKELERKAVPGITVLNVSEALKRKARKGVLDRIKGAGKEYAYIKKKVQKTA